ncbi:MAG: hypothetical protein JWN98_2445 [Abditibacteriota bacterium]|nr:hypothetical protein [Abditibacteriota bacterium]
MKNAWVLAGLAAVAIAGWRISNSRSATSDNITRGVLVIGGVDASGSTRDGLLAQGAFYSKKIAARLDPARDFLSVYRVDRQTHEVASGPAPTSARRFSLHLIQAVRDEASRAGTHPAAFWEQAATEAARSSRPAVVFFFSDGDNDDQSAKGAARLRAAAVRLARNTQVKAIYVWGAKRSNRAALRRLFAGRPAHEVIIQGAGEIDIEPLATRVHQLHNLEDQKSSP